MDWSERRKCQLLNIIPKDEGVIHRPRCPEERVFLERHMKKQYLLRFRTTDSTDGVYPERKFNGLMGEREFAQMTNRDMQEFFPGRIPPYSMDDGRGGKRTLEGIEAARAQFKGYNDEFKTGNTGMLRRHFFVGSHHVERGGVDEEEFAVIQGQAFKIWQEGELMEGYRKESEIDWVEYGATTQPGDSLLWEEDELFEATGREEVSGEWTLAGEANEDAFKCFIRDVDLEGKRYVHDSFARYPAREGS